MKITKNTLVILFSILLISLILHIRYYSDYQTTLQPGVYLKDGASDLRAANWSVPVVFDWDSDGAKDLLVGHNYIDTNRMNHGYVRFYRNTGTDPAPSFKGYTYIQVCSSACSPLDASAFG